MFTKHKGVTLTLYYRKIITQILCHYHKAIVAQLFAPQVPLERGFRAKIAVSLIAS
jgi:hypothetical protein